MAGHQNSRLFVLNSAVVLQNKDGYGLILLVIGIGPVGCCMMERIVVGW